jgi:thiol-disulfide isomerase/thioredoxin
VRRTFRPEHGGFDQKLATLFPRREDALSGAISNHPLGTIRLLLAWGFGAIVACGCTPVGETRPTVTTLLPSDSIDLKSARRDVARDMANTVPFEFDFQLRDISGEWLRKSEFKGKVLIVDIWGTWCPPCREEIPHFIALNQRYRSAGLEIVGLNKENGSPEAQAQKVREFRDKFGIPYRCAIITERIMSQIPDFDGFPTTLFFDKHGKLRLMYVGYHESRELQAAVENLLAED